MTWTAGARHPAGGGEQQARGRLHQAGHRARERRYVGVAAPAGLGDGHRAHLHRAHAQRQGVPRPRPGEQGRARRRPGRRGACPGRRDRGQRPLVRASKRMMRAGMDEEFANHVQHVFLELLPMFRTEDFQEEMRLLPREAARSSAGDAVASRYCQPSTGACSSTRAPGSLPGRWRVDSSRAHVFWRGPRRGEAASHRSPAGVADRNAGYTPLVGSMPSPPPVRRLSATPPRPGRAPGGGQEVRRRPGGACGGLMRTTASSRCSPCCSSS